MAKNVPLRIANLQSINDKCRSKQLIQMFNKLKVCISHDDLEGIDCSLANEIVISCIENKVPHPPTVTSSCYSRCYGHLQFTTKIHFRGKVEVAMLQVWYFRILTLQQNLRMFYKKLLISF